MDYNKSLDDWWLEKRLKYNLGLLVSGLVAFFIYAIVGTSLYGNEKIEENIPHVEDFEITIFTIFFQGMGYLFMMLIANLCYFLGPLVDRKFNKENSLLFRQRLFNIGFWFSCALPFLIPILLVISYLLE